MTTPAPATAAAPATDKNGHPPFLAYLDAGFSCIPIRADGSKATELTHWKQYTKRPPVRNAAEFWASRYKGVAIVGGAVSGNLETLDIDEAALAEPFEAALEAEAPGLLAKMCQTQTPRQDLHGRHGRHYSYRSVVPVAGNTKLALSEPRPQFNADGSPLIDQRTGQQTLKPDTLIETRGEGGYFLTVGCSPECHPTGNLYQHVGGPPLTTLSVLTEAERNSIWQVAKSFSRYEESGKTRAKTPSPSKNGDGKKPGDDFNGRATWEELLEPIGWTKSHNYGGIQYWTRPGKDRGISGTTGKVSADGNELFVCFSQSAHPFEGTDEAGQPGRSYTKFAAYALLNHGGDFTAAAKELAGRGYGTPPAKKKTKTRKAFVIDDEPKFSDLGNARRLVSLHGANIRYCTPWKKWLNWDGKRWAPDQTGEITRRAKDTIAKLWYEAAEASDDERRQIAEFALQSESVRGFTAMVKLAESEERIPVTPDLLDRDPWLLNCTNGTLELRTGRLRPHSQADHLTKLCPVAWEPDAKSELYERFLTRIFAGNQDLIGYVQRVCGMWLTGDVSEQLVHVFYGTGANGKSVFLGAMQGVLGPDYSMKAAADLLMAKRNDSHPTERADLFGKRLACCIETDEGQRFNESLLKDLSGGDRQRARRMREDFWEFEPTHKLVVAVNHKPIVRGTDHGIWRRLRLVPFTVTIPDEEQDHQLPAKLMAEYPGILAWCVRGCLDWLRGGLRCPEEVKAATGEYKEEQDVLGGFLRECCTTNPGDSVKASDLFEAFAKFTGSKMSQTKFGNSLNERGFDRAKIGGTVWRIGIGLEDGELSFQQPGQ